MRALIGTLLIMATFAMSGCVSNHVIRDRAAWETEAAFVNNLVIAEQRAVKALMNRSCQCDAQGSWVTSSGTSDSVCADAAETLVVVRARWAWHYQMMLFNAGTTEKRPSTQAPAIPEASSLCQEMSND